MAKNLPVPFDTPLGDWDDLTKGVPAKIVDLRALPPHVVGTVLVGIVVDADDGLVRLRVYDNQKPMGYETMYVVDMADEPVDAELNPPIDRVTGTLMGRLSRLIDAASAPYNTFIGINKLPESPLSAAEMARVQRMLDNVSCVLYGPLPDPTASSTYVLVDKFGIAVTARRMIIAIERCGGTVPDFLRQKVSELLAARRAEPARRSTPKRLYLSRW